MDTHGVARAKAYDPIAGWADLSADGFRFLKTYEV